MRTNACGLFLALLTPSTLAGTERIDTHVDAASMPENRHEPRGTSRRNRRPPRRVVPCAAKRARARTATRKTTPEDDTPPQKKGTLQDYWLYLFLALVLGPFLGYALHPVLHGRHARATGIPIRPSEAVALPEAAPLVEQTVRTRNHWGEVARALGAIEHDHARERRHLLRAIESARAEALRAAGDPAARRAALARVERLRYELRASAEQNRRSIRAGALAPPTRVHPARSVLPAPHVKPPVS